MAASQIEAILPLSAAQEGILYHTLYAGESSLYIQQYVVDVVGDLDVAGFQEAWARVVSRHQALRSLIAWDEREQPLQIVRPSVRLPWTIEDWSGEDHLARLDAFLEADRRTGFDLEQAPLFRFGLFQTGPDHHVFVWTHHHIVLDGWSLGIAVEEVLASMRGVELSPAPALRAFSSWLTSRDWTDAQRYWKDRLRGIEPGPWLTIERPVASPWASRQHRYEHVISPDLTGRIAAFARTLSITTSAIYRAAWAFLLHRYSGRSQVLFGAAVAGRPPELMGSLEMVGMFVNTVPVPVEIHPDETAASWLQRVASEAVADSAHEAAPLPSIQAWTGVAPDQTLFHSILVMENLAQAEGDGGVTLRNAQYRQESNYPLSILVMPGPQTELVMLFDPDRYSRGDIARLADQLEAVLRALVDGPSARLSDLRVAASDAETVGSETSAALDDTAVLDRIRYWIEHRPDAIAVHSSDATMTYRELGERSRDVAAVLSAGGVRAGDRILMAVPRSHAAIVAMLGVLEAGAVYVPVDPASPPDRRALLGDETEATAVIAGTGSDWTVPLVPIGSDGRVENSGHFRAKPRGTASSEGPEDWAYVMFTSGSTGKPKAVAVTHSNLAASTSARDEVYGSEPPSFMVVSPFHFDSSVAGIYWTLCNGGRLVLPADGDEHDVAVLADTIESLKVTHTLMLPTLYGLILEHADTSALTSLEAVIVAGEACSPGLVASHHAAIGETHLYNEYGPTEATVWCTVALLDEKVGDEISIGSPIPGTTIAILDEALRPTPTGAVGEICVAGPGVAVGYINDAALTAERFVHVELDGVTRRMYRTGDLGRRRDDDSLLLRGRRDHQVKVRGQRIELGEIEAVARASDHVSEAVAVPVRNHDGRISGIALVAEPVSDTEALAAHLRRRLSRAMIPRSVETVERLPRGRTGKIDRAAVEAVAGDVTSAAGTRRQPSSPTEVVLSEIWADVLGLDEIGVDDNFFDLGGDSLVSIRIIARAHQSGLTISPREFFDHPTVAELAAVIDS